MHNSILNHIKEVAERLPQKPAIITSDGEFILYAELYQKMVANAPLPIPLLGEAWDKDFCLYTTGTTGQKKGVIISQRAVIANSENLINAQGFEESNVFIIAGDMAHLGCWSKIFPTLMVGGTLYILKDGLKDIQTFLGIMHPDNHAKMAKLLGTENFSFATFLVPSNIRILLQFTNNNLADYVERIAFIETGAAPMPHSDMLMLCELLPKTRLYNTYASTETGIVCTYNYNDGRCMVGCLGLPLTHSTVFITPEGTIACKGDTLMTGYTDAEELTKEVLRDGVVYTHDNGFIDDEGMLHIQGRQDDIINVGGYKVAPTEIEDVALSHPAIKDCICISQPHPILGQAPVLLVVLNDGYTLNKRDIALHIDAKLERYKVPVAYKSVETIARTANGKLNRKAYK